MTHGVRVIATDHPVLAALLAAPPLARAGVVTQLVPDHDALRAALAGGGPAIALVAAGRPPGDGYALARAIKDDPALAGTRVALVIDGVLDRAAAEALGACGCDDVIAPPLSLDDFCAHLARLSPVPLRRDRRIAVAIDIELPDRALTAQIANVGTGGVGLRLDGALAPGAQVTLRLRTATETGPATAATVAWCRPALPHDARHAPGDGLHATHVAGLAWDGEPPLRTRLLLEQVALFDVEPGPEPGAVDVTLHGDFTELTRFDALAARLDGATTITFDLATVRYISSAGVRAWCDLVERLGDRTLHFRHCSIAFTSQAAMVPLVLAAGTVRSFEAPYYCDACGTDDARLLEVGAIARDGERLTAPRLACPRCGAPSELDDLPDRYFAFLAT